jgi:hypothetical protein
VIWAGSTTGSVHVTRDYGRTWANVTPPDLGDFTRVSLVEASPHDAAVAYLAANRFQLGDLRPLLYKTADYGRTWTKIVAGIPDEEFTPRRARGPRAPRLLYAATERGVWVSFDDGGRWQSLKRDLPPVPVHDLVVKEGDLVVATHGRSFYILDDLSALRQMTPQAAAAPAHLFRPRDAHRVSWGGGGGEGGRAGKNPPSGAVVYYTLAKANQDVTLEFLDPRGTVLRRFTSRLDSLGVADSVRADSGKRARATPDSSTRADTTRPAAPAIGPATGGRARRAADRLRGDGAPRPRTPRVPNKAGLNMFAWDLREPDAVRFEGMILWAGSTTGPVVPPGTYTVRMTVAGQPAQAQTFAVRNDPRSKATAADVEETVALQRRVLAR